MSYRAARTFKAAGRVFAKGEVLQENDPIARAVLDRRPELLQVRAERIGDNWVPARPTAPRKPEPAVARVRDPRPKRDWRRFERREHRRHSVECPIA